MSTIEELGARVEKLFVHTSERHAELASATSELVELYNDLLGAFFPVIDEYWERGSFPNADFPLDEYINLIEKVVAKGTEVIQLSRPVARLMGDAGSAGLSKLMANVARARQIVEQSREQQGVAKTPSNDVLLRHAQSHLPPQSWYEQPEEDLF
jgi:hypothetical protein